MTYLGFVKCVLKVIPNELDQAQHGKLLLCPESLPNSWLYGYHGNSPRPERSSPTASIADRSVFDSSLWVKLLKHFFLSFWSIFFLAVEVF